MKRKTFPVVPSLKHMTACPHTLGKSTAEVHAASTQISTGDNHICKPRQETTIKHQLPAQECWNAFELLSAEGTEHLLGKQGAAQAPPAAVLRMELSTHTTATSKKQLSHKG